MEIRIFVLPYYDRIFHEISFISIAVLHFQEGLSLIVKHQLLCCMLDAMS
jgi:hypothetical protein